MWWYINDIIHPSAASSRTCTRTWSAPYLTTGTGGHQWQWTTASSWPEAPSSRSCCLCQVRIQGLLLTRWLWCGHSWPSCQLRQIVLEPRALPAWPFKKKFEDFLLQVEVIRILEGSLGDDDYEGQEEHGLQEPLTPSAPHAQLHIVPLSVKHISERQAKDVFAMCCKCQAWHADGAFIQI